MKRPNIKSPIIFHIIPALFFLTFIPSIVQADSTDALEWEITADKLTRYENPPCVIAEGNVILEKKKKVQQDSNSDDSSEWDDLLGNDELIEPEEDQADNTDADADAETVTKVLTTIKADWMVYDADLARVKARGNLLIDVGTDQLSADSGVIDLESETGTFDNAAIIREYKEIHLEGKVIQKTGALTYHIEDGWIITCKLKENETPPWSFAAKDADITDDGYAFLKHATFRIKGVPVLYSPYMILPAKRKRQTGFLMPAYTLSDRDGFGLEAPFFINLSPSSDITLYPQYLTKRGAMLGGEFRYTADTRDKGAFMVNYLSDELSDPSEVEYYEETGYTHTNQDRYWIRGKADQDVGLWTTRIDIDVVSDKDYLKEFNTGLTGYSISDNRYQDMFGRSFETKTDYYRENSLQVLRSFDNGSALEGELLIIDDVYDPDSPSNRLWKLPSLSYTGVLPVFDSNSGIDFSWNADYVNYWREEGVGANRFDLFPKLTAAVPLSQYLETTVYTSLRDTFYAIQVNSDNPENYTFEDGDTENRFLFGAGGEIATTMIADFSANIGDVTSWSHTFRPFIAYDYISDGNDNIPYLDTVDSQDEDDGIDNQNIITYGINNYFDIKGESDGSEFDRRYGYFKIEQGYDLRESQSDAPLTPVNIEIGYYPWSRFRLIYETKLPVYEEDYITHSVEVDFNSKRGDFINLDYTYDEEDDTNSISLDTWLVLPYNFAVGYEIDKTFEDDTTVEENFKFMYKPACWSIQFWAQNADEEQTYMLVFSLANLGSPMDLDLPGGSD